MGAEIVHGDDSPYSPEQRDAIFKDLARLYRPTVKIAPYADLDSYIWLYVGAVEFAAQCYLKGKNSLSDGTAAWIEKMRKVLKRHSRAAAGAAKKVAMAASDYETLPQSAQFALLLTRDTREIQSEMLALLHGAQGVLDFLSTLYSEAATTLANSHGFPKDEPLNQLVDELLRIAESVRGHRATYSNAESPSGPFLAFLRTCLSPLRIEKSSKALSRMIDRHKKRRAVHLPFVSPKRL